jgi:hypothetical protein
MIHRENGSLDAGLLLFGVMANTPGADAYETRLVAHRMKGYLAHATWEAVGAAIANGRRAA